MKNLVFKSAAAAGLLGALAMAAPAQAGGANIALAFNGHQHPLVQTAVHAHGRGWRAHQGRIIPLNRVVDIIENRSGGTVTDIRMAKNQRIYRLEGVTRLGMIVDAKVDARTGQIQSIDFKKFRPHYDPNGMDINRLLAKLKRKGFRGFDVVSLRDERSVYRVRALNRHNRPVIVRTDARTGRILTVRSANAYNGPGYQQKGRHGFDHWRKGVAAHGYSHFGKAADYDDYYEVSARDRHGRVVTLDICPYTGRVLLVI